MTKSEVMKLLGWVTANFPHMQERDLRPTAELWHRMLGDIPYQAAEAGIMRIMATARYFPTVAEVRDAAMSFMVPSLPSPGEAWGEVLRAVRRWGFYRPEEAIETLRPTVRKAVEYVGWEEVCSEPEGVIRAHFMRVYEQVAKREQEYALMPQELLDILPGGNGLKMITGGD